MSSMQSDLKNTSYNKIEDSSKETKISGSWLLISRIFWLIITLLVMGLVLLDFFRHPERLYEEISFILMPIGYFVIGVIVYLKKPDDLMGFLSSLMLIIFGPYLISGVNNDIEIVFGFKTLNRFLVTIGGASFMFFLTLFPNGKFVPNWIRWFVYLSVAILAYENLIVSQQYSNVEVLVTVGAFIVGFISQIYRYFKASNGVEKQQTKWVVVGLAGPIFVLTTWFLLTDLGTNRFPDTQFANYLIVVVFTLLALAFPVSIALSILRYRLWDIDSLINKALVYVILSIALAFAFFGGVVIMQQVFRSVTGEESQLALVLSTLAIAALFNPLRKWIQGVIDRRFYRSRYDAVRTLETFSAKLRDEVDLNKLSDELTQAVAESLQPNGVKLWLKSSKTAGHE